MGETKMASSVSEGVGQPELTHAPGETHVEQLPRAWQHI